MWWHVCGLFGGSISVRMPLLEDVGGYECKSGAFLVRVIGPAVALGIRIDMGLILLFLRERWFLSGILPDQSTLIQYWGSGRTVMIFPIVFHLWLCGLWIATMSPACNGERLWVYLLYLSTIFALWKWRISLWRCTAATYSRCGL